MIPGCFVAFRDRDEVTAQKDAGDALDGKDPARQRRFRGAVSLGEIGSAAGKHHIARKKLQGCGIGVVSVWMNMRTLLCARYGDAWRMGQVFAAR